jgi:hypothetical protein
MKAVRWWPEEGMGLEHLTLDEGPDGVVAESVIAGEEPQGPYGLIYRIECDPQWQVTRCAVKLAGGGALDLRRDARGEWTLNGERRDDLRGCTDVDITATPFTNTLPIRRLALHEGERQVIRVAYVRVPALTVEAADQAYTCVESDRAYRYEGLATRFTAELPVDAQRLVLDYPGLFRRARP